MKRESEITIELKKIAAIIVYALSKTYNERRNFVKVEKNVVKRNELK